jgi:sulfatase modifying factor 1
MARRRLWWHRETWPLRNYKFDNRIKSIRFHQEVANAVAQSYNNTEFHIAAARATKVWRTNERRLMKSIQRTAFVLFAFFLYAPANRAITIPTVPVGDAGNPNDPTTGFGGVSYAYNIGTTEVTVGQYTAFLNAVAANDTYSLYNPSMASDFHIAGIARSGSSGSYTYSVIGSANHPVTYVSWGDAARFANWLSKGQPTGTEGPGTTETGAYTLNGAMTDAALMAITRNAGATWSLPNENEWYKAAYYQPAAAGGDSDGYWLYPMKTNGVPYSDQPPGATPNNTHVGNFYNDDGSPNGYDDGYAVTGSTSLSSSQNYLTDVGAYASSAGYYGTFDQGGNVNEWNETAVDSSDRGLRGGSWAYTPVLFFMQASFRYSINPSFDSYNFGFRVASVPEPDGVMLCFVGLIVLALGRGRK